MSKTKAGIIVIVILAGLALVPIALYGTEVEVAYVSFGLSVDSPLSTTGFSGLDMLQIPAFTAGLSNVEVDVDTMNPYEYMLARNTNRTQVSGADTTGVAFVEISITFNLTTPSNQSLVFVLTPGSGQGTGDRNIVTLLGPEDGLTISGTFHLSITITVKVTPPGFDEPVVDLTLEPVNRTFTIPNNP